MNIIVVSTEKSQYLLPINTIINCQSNNNKVVFYLTNNEMVESTKHFTHFEKQLVNSDFFKANNSNLVNINFIQKVIHKDKTTLVLSNNRNIAVSKDNEDTLFRIIENI